MSFLGCHSCLLVIGCILAVLVLPDVCHAYLDPSAGGWLYQLLFPLFLAITGTWAVCRQQVVKLWHRFQAKHGQQRQEFPSMVLNKRQLALVLTAVVTGIVLPVEFLGHLDGYLSYLRVWELFPVFGWAWILYAFSGLACGSILFICTGVGFKLCRQLPNAIIQSLFLAVSLFISLLWLLKGIALWVATSGFPLAQLISKATWIVVPIVGLASLMWVIRSQTTALAVLGWARMTAGAGLAITILAPPLSWYMSHNNDLPQPAVHAQVDARRPNIILITVDALTANHMSLYGYPRPTTPNLDRFAERANVYERFYANSNFTTSSMNSILLGVRPWRHRALQLSARPASPFIDGGLVGQLKAAGYRTSAVISNMYAAPGQNFSSPYFDSIATGCTNRFKEIIAPVINAFPHILPVLSIVQFESAAKHFDKMLTVLGIYLPANHFDPELVFAQARQMIGKWNHEKPSLLWAHLFAPHSPYAAPPPFGGKFDPSTRHRTRFDSSPPWFYLAANDKHFPQNYIGRYDESIAYVDSHIGRFFEWLQTKGLYDDALIIVTADHGESFSHGYGNHSGPALHDDLIHVPLVIKEPYQRRNERLSVLAEQVDLRPTILKYAGIHSALKGEGVEINPGPKLKEIDRPVFSMNFEQNYCFGELTTGTIAVLYGEWKYVRYLGNIDHPGIPVLHDALFNIRVDPGETINMAGIQPEVVQELLAIIEQNLQLYGGPVE